MPDEGAEPAEAAPMRIDGGPVPARHLLARVPPARLERDDLGVGVEPFHGDTMPGAGPGRRRLRGRIAVVREDETCELDAAVIERFSQVDIESAVLRPKGG